MEYCNFILPNLFGTQINRLQPVLNSDARPITGTPKFHHISPILKYLHWLTSLTVTYHWIQYKVHCLTRKSLQKTDHPFSSPFCSCTHTALFYLLLISSFSRFLTENFKNIILSLCSYVLPLTSLPSPFLPLHCTSGSSISTLLLSLLLMSIVGLHLTSTPLLSFNNLNSISFEPGTREPLPKYQQYNIVQINRCWHEHVYKSMSPFVPQMGENAHSYLSYPFLSWLTQTPMSSSIFFTVLK